MNLRNKDNRKKRLISSIMAILLFGTGVSVGKNISKEEYPYECYYPLFSSNNLEGYDSAVPIKLNGDNVIDGKKISKIIDSLQTENKYDELVYAFRTIGSSLYSDIIYVSQSGEPTEVLIVDDLDKIHIVTDDILYKDGEESNIERDLRWQEVDPISTEELNEYEFVPFTNIQHINGVVGTLNKSTTYLLQKKQK